MKNLPKSIRKQAHAPVMYVQSNTNERSTRLVYQRCMDQPKHAYQLTGSTLSTVCTLIIVLPLTHKTASNLSQLIQLPLF